MEELSSQAGSIALVILVGVLTACTEPVVEPVVRKVSEDPFEVVSTPQKVEKTVEPQRDSREQVWKSLVGEALYEVKLSDGSILPGGTIRRVNATEVLLSHANGLAVLKLADATPQIQQMCLFDPGKTGKISAPVSTAGAGAQRLPERQTPIISKPAPRVVKIPPKRIFEREIPDETTLKLKISRAKAKVESLKSEKVTLQKHYETEDYRYRYRRSSVRTSAIQRAKNLTKLDEEIGRHQLDISEAETLLGVLADRRAAALRSSEVTDFSE